MAANSRTLSPRKNDCGFLLRWGQIISSLTTGAVHERRRDGFLPWWFPGEAFGDGYNFPAGTLINHVICNHPEIHSACHSACHSAALATHISACHHGHGVAKPEPGQNWVWKSDSHRISIYIIYERNVREVSPWDLWVSYQTNPIWIGKLKKWGCLTPNITKLWHGLCRSIRKCQSLQGMCQLLSVEKNSHFGHKEADVTLLHIQRLYVFTQFHKAIALRTCLVQDTCLVILLHFDDLHAYQHFYNNWVQAVHAPYLQQYESLWILIEDVSHVVILWRGKAAGRCAANTPELNAECLSLVRLRPRHGRASKKAIRPSALGWSAVGDNDRSFSRPGFITLRDG